MYKCIKIQNGWINLSMVGYISNNPIFEMLKWVKKVSFNSKRVMQWVLRVISFVPLQLFLWEAHIGTP